MVLEQETEMTDAPIEQLGEAKRRKELTMRAPHGEDQARQLKETTHELPLLVNIGREATSVWLRRCYRGIAQQVATICFSSTLQQKIHLTHLIQHEDTQCKESCCMALTKEIT